MKTRRLLHHRSHGAIFFLGETDRLLQRRHVNFKTRDHMVDSHCREHLGWTLGLIGFDPHLVTSDSLVILLAEDSDNVERRAPGQSSGDQFNRLWAGASGRIVQQQMMAASGLGHKLALLPKWLIQFDFSCDHDGLLLLLLSTKHTNKCKRTGFVTGKLSVSDGWRTQCLSLRAV